MTETSLAAAVEDPENAIEAVEQVDLVVTDALADTRRSRVVRALGTLSEVADQPQMRALTLGAAVVGLYRRDRRLVRAGLRGFAAHTLATWAKSAIKRQIDRTRPDAALDDGYSMAPGHSREHHLSSFPSGHTAGALAVARAAARDYPDTNAAGLALSAAVALIQVPRAKHYVSDIVVGAAIGLVAEAASSWAFDRAEAFLTSDS